jgi:hypothetical protein
MSRESIIEKIRNLMQRTDQTGCSEAEVEAAMKIARKMMDTHQVEMADLMEAQKRSYTLDDIVEQVVRTHCKLDRWEKSMMSCVTILTDTKCYMTYDHKYNEKGKWTKVYKVVYYGEREDVAAAHALYVELLIVFKSMARHRLGQKWTQAHYHYMEGFGNGMLTVFHEERRQAAVQRTETCTGMIRHKSQLIATYAENKLKLKTAISKGVKKTGENSTAFSQGHADGRAYKASAPVERSKKLD